MRDYADMAIERDFNDYIDSIDRNDYDDPFDGLLLIKNLKEPNYI